jgi:hypothetical protein
MQTEIFYDFHQLREAGDNTLKYTMTTSASFLVHH